MLVSQLTYVATDCRVSVAHRQMVCLTTAGTGRDLMWGAIIGGQPSGVFTNQTTNYHPPIISYYSGAGSTNANTTGNELVWIDGRNFGPLGTIVQSATYGWKGADFNASGCAVIIAHTRVQCFTAVGAGTGLSWLITVDSQQSVAPTTNYAPPLIIGFHPAGTPPLMVVIRCASLANTLVHSRS
jgi:hypothetical protein